MRCSFCAVPGEGGAGRGFPRFPFASLHGCPAPGRGDRSPGPSSFDELRRLRIDEGHPCARAGPAKRSPKPTPGSSYEPPRLVSVEPGWLSPSRFYRFTETRLLMDRQETTTQQIRPLTVATSYRHVPNSNGVRLKLFDALLTTWPRSAIPGRTTRRSRGRGIHRSKSVMILSSLFLGENTGRSEAKSPSSRLSRPVLQVSVGLSLGPSEGA